VLGGLPVFRGTRVPARALLEYLAAGDSLETFLDDFPSVRREQALALLELASSCRLGVGLCARCSMSASHAGWLSSSPKPGL
jgi:hypothetical protein